MDMHFKQFKKTFGTKKDCYNFLLRIRMGEQITCLNPNCGGNIHNDYTLLNNRGAYLCRKCLHHFYPKVDSIFDHSKIDLVDWFEIIFRFLSQKNGISALQIQRDYNLSYKTAFNILHDIRHRMGECMKNIHFTNTVVEIDESYILTGNKGMNRHFHWKKGRGSEHTSSVLIIKERNGKGIMLPIMDCSSDSIIPLIVKYVDMSCTIYTDNWDAYNGLESLGYKHEFVDHNKYGPGRFKNGSASTNSCESAWSMLKKTIKGVYGSISHKYLANYLNERSFRANYGNDSDSGFLLFMDSLSPLKDTYGTPDNPFSYGTAA